MKSTASAAILALLLALPVSALRKAAPEEPSPAKDSKAMEPAGKPAPRPPADRKMAEQVPAESADRIDELFTRTQVVILPGEIDGRLALVDGKPLVVVHKDGHAIFQRCSVDGGTRTALFEPGHPVTRWWVSPDGGRLAWVSGDSLYTATPGAKTMDTLDVAPDGDVSFSADGKIAAWVAGGKATVRSFAGAPLVTLTPAEEELLGGEIALSPDGRQVYATLCPAGSKSADGLGACDLSKDGRVLTRVFTASSSTLRSLSVSADASTVLFVQHPVGTRPVESLRLFFAATGDVKTIARATEIADPRLVAGRNVALFSGRAANGKWAAWSVPTTEDASKGTFLAEPFATLEGQEFRQPSLSPDGTAWVVMTHDGGKTWSLGKVAAE